MARLKRKNRNPLHKTSKNTLKRKYTRKLVPALNTDGTQKFMPDVLSKLSNNPEKRAKQKQYIVHKGGYQMSELEILNK